MLERAGVDCPKVLIFCRTQLLAGWLFEKILIRLKSLNMIGMYHGNTLDDKKQIILESLKTNDKEKRLVVCTSALGCGVDCTDIKFVLHFLSST